MAKLEINSKAQGAELTSIKLDGIEKLHQGENVLDENGKFFWNRHAPILFPIVGQIKNGTTIIEGKEYKMSQHGFARDMEFEEIKKDSNTHKYVLKSNEKTLEKFPYKFELYITYTIENNSLEIKCTVINKDNKEMQFGLGGHPAFVCDYSSGDYELEFNKNEDNFELLKLDNGLIGKEHFENIIKENKIRLHKDIFNEDAIIMKNLKSNEITLKDTRNNKIVLKFDFTGFPYLAIWSKKGAPFVCIEPWFNTADNIDSDGIFEHKENILKINPNDNFECKYKVEFYN